MTIPRQRAPADAPNRQERSLRSDPNPQERSLRRAHRTQERSPRSDPRTPERDYPAHLARLAEGRDVRFVGQVSDRELEELYRTARVVVLPSVHETCYGKRVEISELLGLSVLEAMASGTPVIASRIGGVPEVVADGETGFLVEPGNVSELRDRLEQVLANDDLRERMGANARQHVVERFTWDRCAERCLAAYEDVIGAA